MGDLALLGQSKNERWKQQNRAFRFRKRWGSPLSGVTAGTAEEGVSYRTQATFRDTYMTELLALEEIARRVLQVRGQKVLLDADLAMLYGVETRRLNEQVKRNPERFPEDFMFQLTEEEWEALRSHFAILKLGRGQHRKYLPYVFTEHGASMAANVLSSARAVVVSIYIVRAFIALREAHWLCPSPGEAKKRSVSLLQTSY